MTDYLREEAPFETIKFIFNFLLISEDNDNHI